MESETGLETKPDSERPDQKLLVVTSAGPSDYIRGSPFPEFPFHFLVSRTRSLVALFVFELSVGVYARAKVNV